MNYKQKEIETIDNKDKIKSNILNDYGYNFYSKRVLQEDYSKEYHFRNKTKKIS